MGPSPRIEGEGTPGSALSFQRSNRSGVGRAAAPQHFMLQHQKCRNGIFNHPVIGQSQMVLNKALTPIVLQSIIPFASKNHPNLLGFIMHFAEPILFELQNASLVLMGRSEGIAIIQSAVPGLTARR